MTNSRVLLWLKAKHRVETTYSNVPGMITSDHRGKMWEMEKINLHLKWKKARREKIETREGKESINTGNYS